MNKNEINQTIDEYVAGALDIDENFMGSDRINIHEKEQRFYITQFQKLGIARRITSDIYSHRNSPEEIQKIKDNLEKYMVN